MLIKKEALKLLSRLVISCEPLGMKNMPHEAYLVAETKKNEDVSVEDFVKGFPGEIDFYNQLSDLAETSGTNSINEEIVIKFFGSRGHVSKVLSDIEAFGELFSEDKKRVMLFIHLLLPVEITSKTEKGFSGLYENRNSVKFENLHAFSEDGTAISEGSTVLVHFSSIIQVNPDKKIVDYLINEQNQSPEFKQAIAHLAGKTIKQPMLMERVKKLSQKYGL